MSEINVIKLDQTENSTVSKLLVDGQFICFVIEDGERESKIHGITRIPAGRYNLVRQYSGRFFDRYSERYQHSHVWCLENVPNFTGILFHKGNTIGDTRGCLLPNKYYDFDGSNYFGVNSAPAYKRLYETLKYETSHKIDIIR